MKHALLVCVIAFIGCGGSPVATSLTPSPQPAPVPAPVPTPAPAPALPRFIYTGRVVSTQTGIVIPNATIALDGVPAVQADASGAFSVDAGADTVHAFIAAPGYRTRETRLSAGRAVTVDLIATAAPFSSIFYGQLVRNVLEETTPDVVRTLPASPALYLQTTGLSSANIDHLVAAAREIVPMMTGGRLTLTTVETGTEFKPARAGWIVTEIINEGESGICGRATVGAVSGRIWLNIGEPRCALGADAISPIAFRHEMAHALGFFHIDVPNSLMHHRGNFGPGLPTDSERYHAAIAYRRQAGNRDPDNDDPRNAPLRLATPVIVD